MIFVSGQVSTSASQGCTHLCSWQGTPCGTPCGTSWNQKIKAKESEVTDNLYPLPSHCLKMCRLCLTGSLPTQNLHPISTLCTSFTVQRLHSKEYTMKVCFHLKLPVRCGAKCKCSWKYSNFFICNVQNE